MLNVKKHKQIVNGNPQNKDRNGVNNTSSWSDRKLASELSHISGGKTKDWGWKKWGSEDRQAAIDLLGESGVTEQGGKSGSAPGWMGAVTQGIGAVTSGFREKNDTVSEQSLKIRDSISDAAIQSGIPIAMAIGAATKIVDAIGDATGFHIDDIDKDAGNRAGVDGGARFLNNAMNALPGNSLLMAAFSPGKTIKARSLNAEGEDIIAGYSGTNMDIDAANKLGNKRTLFGIGRGKMNSFIEDANKDTITLNQLGYTNSLAKNSDYNINLAQQNLNRYAGTMYNIHAVGKNGLKILSRKELQSILAKRLQKGGLIGTDTNILPEGALHARLNHLNETNEDLKDVTKKGIPVLDAEGSQIAEVESDELILRLELTKKIEELMKDGSEEAMIEAGKILTYEIIDNTQDNTGQITEEVQDGK